MPQYKVHVWRTTIKEQTVEADSFAAAALACRCHSDEEEEMLYLVDSFDEKGALSEYLWFADPCGPYEVCRKLLEWEKSHNPVLLETILQQARQHAGTLLELKVK